MYPDISKDWTESWDLCRQDGAVLVAMETPEEHNRLKIFLQPIGGEYLIINLTSLDLCAQKQSPKIKWQKIAFYKITCQKCVFLYSMKQHFLPKILSKYFFHIILLDFSNICGLFEGSFK